MPGGPTRWGWHRLTDETARSIVAGARITRGDLVLDIGAGTGALTAALVATGARVVAFELHPARARVLRTRFAPSEVKVVVADATDLRLPRRPFHVVANPPFAITTGLVSRLVAPGSRLLRADLVLSRWAAVRWSRPDAPGARRWSVDFDARVTRTLPRAAFVPPPPSDTAVLRIERR